MRKELRVSLKVLLMLSTMIPNLRNDEEGGFRKETLEQEGTEELKSEPVH